MNKIADVTLLTVLFNEFAPSHPISSSVHLMFSSTYNKMTSGMSFVSFLNQIYLAWWERLTAETWFHPLAYKNVDTKYLP